MLLPANIFGIVPPTSSGTSVFVSPSTSAGGTLTSAVFDTQGNTPSALFFLNVNQVSPSSSHNLDVYVQHSPDGGITYDDFAHFNQVPGKTPTTSTQVAQWIRDAGPSSSAVSNYQSVRSMATASLAAGLVLQGPVGPTWRAQAVVNGGSSSQPWKMTLSANLNTNR